MESCTKCGNPNVIIKRKASGQALCKDCFIESVEFDYLELHVIEEDY